MPKKILIITGDAGESYEALYAKHRMAEIAARESEQNAALP